MAPLARRVELSSAVAPLDRVAADQVVLTPIDLGEPPARLAPSGIDSHADPVSRTVLPRAYRPETVPGSLDDEFDPSRPVLLDIGSVELLVALGLIGLRVGDGCGHHSGNET